MLHEPRLHELTRNLVGILQDQSAAMAALQHAIAGQRGAFVSLGRSRLESGLERIEGPSHTLVELERRRIETCRQLAQELGFSNDLRVSRILGRLPRELADSLQAAARLASEKARRIRQECLVGFRLLRLSEEANAGILEALLGTSRKIGTSYDRNARTNPAGLPGGGIVSGTA